MGLVSCGGWWSPWLLGGKGKLGDGFRRVEVEEVSMDGRRIEACGERWVLIYLERRRTSPHLFLISEAR